MPEADQIRPLVWSLATAGMLAGHSIGYGMADLSHAPDHGYMSLLVPAALLAAVGIMVSITVRVARRLPRLNLRVGRLLAAQVLLYLILEVTERVIGSGLGDLLSPPVLLGLLAQLPVAVFLVGLVRVSEELAERLVAARVRVPSGAASGDLARLPEQSWARQVSTVPVGRRGPPLVRPA